MKEHPILFSAPMIRAILENRKTQTRRVIKFPPDFTGEEVWPNGSIGVKYSSHFDGVDIVKRLRPRWQVGDVLWVRETWRPKTHSFPTGWPYEYRATAEQDGTPTHGIWKPSIFMPRAASRLTLEIADIRAERLQDISESDAAAEGIERSPSLGLYRDYMAEKRFGRGEVVTKYPFRPRESFFSLWESINGEGSWAQNPFVWAITFKNV